MQTQTLNIALPKDLVKKTETLIKKFNFDLDRIEQLMRLLCGHL